MLAAFVLSQAVYAAGPAAVNLRSAGSFAILSKSGISTTGATSIVGDIGVSPAAATYITGFGLILDSSNQFSRSSLVNGKVYAADYAPPTPTKMTTAVSDMQTAYTDAAGRSNPTATELGAGNIGGMTLAPGLYKWSTGVIVPTDVTLSGGSNDVWIFQIAQTLGVGNGAHVVLSGGAQPQNIFWQVGGQATLGTTSDVKGIILSQTAVVLNTGARLNGRAMAQTAVTLNANAVTAPTASSSPTPTPSPSPTASPTPKPSVSPTPSATSTPKPSVTATSTPKPTIGSTATPTIKGSTATPTTVGRASSTPVPKATVTPTPSVKPTTSVVQQKPKQQSFVDGIAEFFSNIFNSLAKSFGK